MATSSAEHVDLNPVARARRWARTLSAKPHPSTHGLLHGRANSPAIFAHQTENSPTSARQKKFKRLPSQHRQGKGDIQIKGYPPALQPTARACFSGRSPPSRKDYTPAARCAPRIMYPAQGKPHSEREMIRIFNDSPPSGRGTGDDHHGPRKAGVGPPPAIPVPKKKKKKKKKNRNTRSTTGISARGRRGKIGLPGPRGTKARAPAQPPGDRAPRLVSQRSSHQPTLEETRQPAPKQGARTLAKRCCEKCCGKKPVVALFRVADV